MKLDVEKAKTLLRNLPVSINNLADPVILRESTALKMEQLIQDKHTGPVALITKGNLNTPWWKDHLAYWAKHLSLFVFVSISELDRSWEKGASSEKRYQNLTTIRDAGAYAMAYLRPIIHTVNDSPEIVTKMFRESSKAGAHAIVSSGFRGDEQVVSESGLQSIPAPDGQEWMKTLKLTPQDTSHLMEELADRYSIPYWTRTHCAVAYFMGKPRTINPYYIAPKFVGCARCPLQGTCESTAQFIKPAEGSIELLHYLGFNVEVHTATERYRKCPVEIRSECTLCCTNCPVAPANMGIPYINIRTHNGDIPSWGEMSLARFLTGGMLATDPNIPPGENSNIRLHPRFKLPDGKNGVGQLYGVNSWLVWSEYVPKNKCFKCKYCFLSMFEDILPPELQVTVGLSPLQILNYEMQ